MSRNIDDQRPTNNDIYDRTSGYDIISPGHDTYEEVEAYAERMTHEELGADNIAPSHRRFVEATQIQSPTTPNVARDEQQFMEEATPAHAFEDGLSSNSAAINFFRYAICSGNCR